MGTINLRLFGGMLPRFDDRLLPPEAAAHVENAWLYSGAFVGLPTEQLLVATTLADVGKVYRLPASYTNPTYLYGSTWLEFLDPETDIIRSPVFGDLFDRYYWASLGIVPKYNTRDRIEYSNNIQVQVVTISDATDLVSWTAHGLAAGNPVKFATDGALPSPLVAGTIYYVSADSLAADEFKLSLTRYAAITIDTPINITTAGSGTHTLTTTAEAEWILGMVLPSIPSVAPTGGSGAADTRSYVVTWVTEYGEESAPSPPHTVTGLVDDTWTVTMPSVASTDLGVDRTLLNARIYRTVVSASGVATYFLVTELDIDVASYADTDTDATIAANSQLESTTWTAPPNLAGFTLLPNGVIAGFVGNELWLSEPYRPHAWPAEYALTVEFPIVGLGVVGQMLVICTQGYPVTGTGSVPSNFTTSKLTSFEPCTSRRSVISSPEGVYYTSTNGLVRVTPGEVNNITRDMMTRDKWQQLVGTQKARAARFGTAYYAFGGPTAGVFEETAFDEDAFTQENFADARAGIIMDTVDSRVAFGTLADTEIIYGVDNDVWSGEVFLLKNDSIYWINQEDMTLVPKPAIWKSKIFQSNLKDNFGVMKVFFEATEGAPTLNPVRNTANPQTLDADQWGLIRLYADDELKMTRELRTSGELWKLPSGFKGEFWQIEVEARVRILSVHMAGSAKELAVT